MAKYFRLPFGVDGDRTTVPDPAQPDGTVSYDIGFGPDYQLDPDTDPDALNVPRNQFNEIIFQTQDSIRVIQEHGFPDWISAADNDGVDFPYDAQAFVRYNDVVYYSLIDNNTFLPTNATYWSPLISAPASAVVTGSGFDFWGISLPSGYVWANGTTIGNASSNATGRANADTAALFTLLWNATTNTNLQLYNSVGATVARGISAAVDYAANRALAVPDKRNLVSIGKGDMGGVTDRGLITTAGCGIDGATMAASGGAQNVSLSANQNGTHSHGASTDSAGTHTHSIAWDSGGSQNLPGPGVQNGTMGNGNDRFVNDVNTIANAGAHTHTVTVNNSGTGEAHLNVQPSIVCNYILKL